MNNIISYFDKNKRELSNNSNDGQDTRKKREASSMELSFEKASDGDVFKDSLKSEDCIFKLKRRMENIERKREELCITTKNSELQLVSMNETINFISEKFDESEKDVNKTKLLKFFQKKQHLK